MMMNKKNETQISSLDANNNKGCESHSMLFPVAYEDLCTSLGFIGISLQYTDDREKRGCFLFL